MLYRGMRTFLAKERRGGEGREREVGNFSFVWPRRAIIELVVMAKVF